MVVESGRCFLACRAFGVEWRDFEFAEAKILLGVPGLDTLLGPGDHLHCDHFHSLASNGAEQVFWRFLNRLENEWGWNRQASCS
jgi:hypothetical protein